MKKNKRLERKYFSRLHEVLEIPDLLEIQIKSFREFLQRDVAPDKRKKIGLQELFEDHFPITDMHGRKSLEFVSYSIGDSRYSIEECRQRGKTYAASLKVKFRLVLKDEDGIVIDIIEQEIFMGEIPLMTPTGSFIINGAERVVVNQLHRSAGVSFERKPHPSGKSLYVASIVPYRGSWVEFILDNYDILYVTIDKKKKIPATVFLRVFGFDIDELMEKFYPKKKAIVHEEDIVGDVLANDVIDFNTGEIVGKKYSTISAELVELLDKLDISEVFIYKKDDIEKDGGFFINTLNKEDIELKDINKSLAAIYRVLKGGGDPPNYETARKAFKAAFGTRKNYDLSKVGRFKLNKRLELDSDSRLLTQTDILRVLEILIDLRRGIGEPDDIDHLGNRRVRSVGELLFNQFESGLSRMSKNAIEKMNSMPVYTTKILPYELINSRTLSKVVQSFFGTSQLSQFMAQENPLAELTHKRRLVAIGPGGLNRDRAGFEVRDVHHTHYGRMCPIETPEGPNIGLITSLTLYARTNKYGFLETPYRVVKDGVVTDEVKYFPADEEDLYTIAPATLKLDENNRILGDFVSARRRGEYVMVAPKEINFMDISVRQMFSLSTCLIPFLEHDDTNRALMGSNMQRQAVPILKPEAPIVGTGMEHKAAYDSGTMVIARRRGKVVKATASEIIIEADDEMDLMEFTKYDSYQLRKFERSNQNTAINQKLLVNEGDIVEKGDVIADGQATDRGDLALGMNVLVGFMPWQGYNFEDAIIINENLVKEDAYTSVHIHEYSIDVLDTKLGPEEITRDLPNTSDEFIKHLDENGIVKVCTYVKGGDILVGKITPQGEKELSAEEKLIKAIFGSKAGEYKDSSLRLGSGEKGTVVDVRVYSRKDKKDTNDVLLVKEENKIDRKRKREIRTLDMMLHEKIRSLITGKIAKNIVYTRSQKEAIPQGETITEEILNRLKMGTIDFTNELTTDRAVNSTIAKIRKIYLAEVKKINDFYDREVEKLYKGDELPAGALKTVKVYIAEKKKLSVGDKMAGRHGNKGVVSIIVPEADMPYLEDGRPLDILLNPLGVPSRMNVGQILETTLGFAAQRLGINVATPVFDGARIEDIKEMLDKAGLPSDGKVYLYDGRTGERFLQKTTVGYIYMLKLSHLVDDKMHARSVGPYSLVNQQPLGGKSMMGGQRLGEMEVWAFEAYGAAYALQEALTVKSDDIKERTRMYESIIKGFNPPSKGIPESFNVLVKEMMSLGLRIELNSGKRK